MKRLGSLFGLVLLGSTVAGCDGGVEVGAPKEAPPTSQTNEFKDMMKKAGDKMTKGQMRKGATPPAAKTKSAPEETKSSP